MKRSLLVQLALSLLLAAALLPAAARAAGQSPAPTTASSASPAATSAAPAAPAPAPSVDPKITARAAEWYHRLETGSIDRSQLTPELSQALTPKEVTSIAAQLGMIGDPTKFQFVGEDTHGTATAYIYRVDLSTSKAVQYVFALDNQGKVAGLSLTAAP